MNTRYKWIQRVTLAACIGVCAIAPALAVQKELPKKYTETITTKNGDKLSFDMVLIPAGTFQMGSPATQADRKDSEGPQREVKLDGFYLCSTEATLDFFLAYYQETSTAKEAFVTAQEAKKNAAPGAGGVNAVTGPTPVYGDMTMGYGPKNPAIGMSWHNAVTFCKWLSLKTGKTYRLPTEAEWEYACRAGANNAYGFADTPEKLEDYAWFEDNCDAETNPVGKKKPNAWGLYDMQGNVREWVHDFYSPTGYAGAAAVNPQGPEDGKVHVARGGDHSSPAAELRCTARAFEEVWWRAGDPQIPKSKWWLPEMDIIGFRVALSLQQEK